MKRFCVLSLAMMLFLVTSCRKEKNQLTVDLIEEPPQVLVEIEMKGVVKDEGGIPIVNAQVQMAGKITSTNSEGEFRFPTTEVPQSSVLIEVSHDGYFGSSTINYARAESRSFSSVTLMEKGNPVSIEASDGGVVATNGGAALKFSPGSFKSLDGQPYNGPVDVYSRWIDPTASNISDIMPGALIGEREDDSRAVLATYGMITFELEGSNGEALVLDEQMGAELEFPIPAGLQSGAPNEIPFWFFDSQEAQWLERGTSIRDGTKYTGTASGPGTWNCDIPLDPVFLKGILMNADENSAAAYVRVSVEDLNTNFYYGGYTDSSGYFGGYVPKDAPLQLTSFDQCGNQLISMDLGGYSADTVDLDTIVLDDTVEQFSIRVSGQLVSCNGNPITSGYITLRYPGNTLYFRITADGSFSGVVPFNCTSNRPDIIMTGYDLTHRLRSIDYIVTAAGGDVDLGTVMACEISEDFLSIDFNGETIYHIPAEYTIGEAWDDQMEIFVITEGGGLWMGINNYSGSGVYGSNGYLVVYNIDGVAPEYPSLNIFVSGINITVTSDDGTYIIGVLSGSSNDLVTGETINILGNFKAKKKQ